MKSAALGSVTAVSAPVPVTVTYPVAISAAVIVWVPAPEPAAGGGPVWIIGVLRTPVFILAASSAKTGVVPRVTGPGEFKLFSKVVPFSPAYCTIPFESLTIVLTIV